MNLQELDSGVPGDYINTRNANVRREHGGHPLKCIFVAFGLLCILQATLNISLRLYSKTDERQEAMNIMSDLAKQGWLNFNNSFYFISTSMKSWTDSRNYCLQNNADLVIINSREEQEFITRWHSNRLSWIGLSIQGPQGNWQWVDGTNLTLSYWGVGEPNAGPYDEDCAQVWQKNWEDVDCSQAKAWVCETTQRSKRAEIGETGPQPFPREAWEPFGGSYYHFASSKQSWQDSRMYCRQRNADLVIINNKEEDEFIRSKIGAGCWIGLSDLETEGEWKWVDGSGVTFVNWGTNEPNGHGKKEECAETRSWALPNIWSDGMCDDSNFWTCEKVSGVPRLEGDLHPHKTNDVHSWRSVVPLNILLLVVAMFIF